MTPKATDPARDELLARIADRQRAVARAIHAHHRPAFMDSTLTMQQLRVLVTLSMNGPTSGQELAGVLGVGPGTVTGIVDRLASHGLVTRGEDPDDRRVRPVALSGAGTALIERIMDWGDRYWRALFDQLDADTLLDLDRVLGKLQEAAERMRDEPDPRPSRT